MQVASEVEVHWLEVRYSYFTLASLYFDIHTCGGLASCGKTEKRRVRRCDLLESTTIFKNVVAVLFNV